MSTWQFMTMQGQGHSLTFVQGLSGSTFSNFFSSETSSYRLIEAKWYGASMGCGEWKFVKMFQVTWPFRRVLVNSKFGVFYSNFLSLTPTFLKVLIEKYSKTSARDNYFSLCVLYTSNLCIGNFDVYRLSHSHEIYLLESKIKYMQ